MSEPRDPKRAPSGEPVDPNHEEDADSAAASKPEAASGAGAGEQDEARLDDDDVRALLKKAMRVEEAKAPPPDVLRGVQRKIRQRSRGKFYADGWSTAPSPKSTYFVTAAVMLALLVALYFFLVPSGWGIP